MGSPPPTTIEPLVEMAGFFAAHGIWCVSDGEVLVPMLAYQSEGGMPQMLRLTMDRLEVAVAHGRQWLTANPEGAVHAVLVYDSYLSLPEGRFDALTLEFRAFGPQPVAATMAVPYRSAGSAEGFAIHRPSSSGSRQTIASPTTLR